MFKVQVLSILYFNMTYELPSKKWISQNIIYKYAIDELIVK